jgi:hypothetical protein
VTGRAGPWGTDGPAPSAERVGAVVEGTQHGCVSLSPSTTTSDGSPAPDLLYDGTIRLHRHSFYVLSLKASNRAALLSCEPVNLATPAQRLACRGNHHPVQLFGISGIAGLSCRSAAPRFGSPSFPAVESGVTLINSPRTASERVLQFTTFGLYSPSIFGAGLSAGW